MAVLPAVDNDKSSVIAAGSNCPLEILSLLIIFFVLGLVSTGFCKPMSQFFLPFGVVPKQRISPPMSTITPAAPRSLADSMARSMAYPLAIAPRSSFMPSTANLTVCLAALSWSLSLPTFAFATAKASSLGNEFASSACFHKLISGPTVISKAPFVFLLYAIDFSSRKKTSLSTSTGPLKAAAFTLLI